VLANDQGLNDFSGYQSEPASSVWLPPGLPLFTPFQHIQTPDSRGDEDLAERPDALCPPGSPTGHTLDKLLPKVPILPISTSWLQAIYFTVLDNVYCRDLDGTIYLVDKQSCYYPANVYPNPVLPYSTFQLGPFSYRFDEDGLLYSLKDSFTSPWEPKFVYEDVHSAMESLTAQTGPTGLEENSGLNEIDWEALLKTLEVPPSSNSGFRDAGMESWSGGSDPGSEGRINSSSWSTSTPILSQSPSLPSSSSSSSPHSPNRISSPRTTETPSSPDVQMIALWTRADVDKWVDSLKDQRKCRGNLKSRPELECPWDGCETVSRRPQVLKDHLYIHLHIKPYKCSRPGCTAAFNTASNRHRHVKSCSTVGNE